MNSTEKYYFVILLCFNIWLVSLNDESFTEEHAAVAIRIELMKQVKIRNSRKKDVSKKSDLLFGGALGGGGLGTRRLALGGGRLGAFSRLCGGGGGAAFRGLGYRGAVGGFGGPLAGAFGGIGGAGGGAAGGFGRRLGLGVCGGGCGR